LWRSGCKFQLIWQHPYIPFFLTPLVWRYDHPIKFIPAGSVVVAELEGTSVASVVCVLYEHKYKWHTRERFEQGAPFSI
jgi:hypothetical protein